LAADWQTIQAAKPQLTCGPTCAPAHAHKSNTVCNEKMSLLADTPPCTTLIAYSILRLTERQQPDWYIAYKMRYQKTGGAAVPFFAEEETSISHA